MEKIKKFEEVYRENINTPDSERHWYNSPCVKCTRKIKKSPISVNIYEQVGIMGHECGKKDCVVVWGSEEHKKLYWQAHLLQVILNPDYWGEGVAEKVWDNLQEYADANKEQMPNVNKKMREFPILEIIKFMLLLKK